MIPGALMNRVLAVNIDLDDLRFYRGIHALPQQPENAEIFKLGLPRFLDLCERHEIKATLFVITDDLKIPGVSEAIRDAARRGHEIASHTRSHDYGISRRDPDSIAAELAGSRRDILNACGIEPTGFRGPGYNLTPDLLDGLIRAGFLYDTSIMSSPPYWLARALIIAAMAATGRKSSSITGRARDFFRGHRPFVWGGPGKGLVEFPITTAGPLFLPLIGTTLAGRGALVRQAVTIARGREFVNIEFHGIDFLDREADGLEPELLVEPALKIPLAERMHNFDLALRMLGEGRRSPTLATLAASFSAS